MRCIKQGSFTGPILFYINGDASVVETIYFIYFVNQLVSRHNVNHTNNLYRRIAGVLYEFRHVVPSAASLGDVYE